MPSATTEEGVKSLAAYIRDLNEKLNIPASFLDAGLNEKEFLQKLDLMADRAYEDQCTPVNPKQPKVSDLAAILKQAYYGK